jgi:hypothetical protein
MLLTACKSSILEVEAPQSDTLQNELSHILNDLFITEFKSKVSYEDGRYFVTGNRELSDKEFAILNKYMNTLIKAQGPKSYPSLQLEVTEKRDELLKTVGAEFGRKFLMPMSSSTLELVSRKFIQLTLYQLAIVFTSEAKLPNMGYQEKIGNNDATRAMQGTAVGQFLMGISDEPHVIKHQLSIVMGDEILPLEEKLEDEYQSSLIIPLGDIYAYNPNNDYYNEGPNESKMKKRLYKFHQETGVSELLLTHILYPTLAKDAISFEIPNSI